MLRFQLTVQDKRIKTQIEIFVARCFILLNFNNLTKLTVIYVLEVYQLCIEQN